MGGVVDLRTGKIIGCEKNSFAWFHEKGHIEFNSTEKGIRINYKREMFSNLGVLFMLVAFFVNFAKYVAAIYIGIAIYYFIYEEMWCNNYAREKLKVIKCPS